MQVILLMHIPLCAIIMNEIKLKMQKIDEIFLKIITIFARE